MRMTHIIRGDDHISNTPAQIQIYRALGWKEPIFAHLSMIHGPDGKKLSKRHGATNVVEFRNMGYLPEALKNYLKDITLKEIDRLERGEAPVSASKVRSLLDAGEDIRPYVPESTYQYLTQGGNEHG